MVSIMASPGVIARIPLGVVEFGSLAARYECIEIAWVDLLGRLIICLTVLGALAIVAVFFARTYKCEMLYKVLTKRRRDEEEDDKWLAEREDQVKRERLENAWRCIEHYWKKSENGTPDDLECKAADRALRYLISTWNLRDSEEETENDSADS